MLRFPKHGAATVPDSALQDDRYTNHVCVSEACGYAPTDPSPDLVHETGAFAYLFPFANEQTGGDTATLSLDVLGSAMVDMAPSEHDNGPIPPVFTYWGQFIDHDVTAAMDVASGFTDMHTTPIQPVDRAAISGAHRNARAGSLNLDSLYGDGPLQGSLSRSFAELLRYPDDRAKMWIGTLENVTDSPVEPPHDPGGDLLRLGRVLDKSSTAQKARGVIDSDTPFAASLAPGGTVNRVAAMIGDRRNDENLFIAQFHLAMLRFHNKVVDSAHHHGAPVEDREALFRWARTMVTWHYQWLVLNQYLPTVCDPNIVDQVIGNGAPLYAKFFADNPPVRGDLMPIPLEFAGAAYRFGHSQVRAAYDWNKFFGRSDDGSNLLDSATFDLMFAFTGEARARNAPGSDPSTRPAPMNGRHQRLPNNWPADWSRLSGNSPQDFPDRSARKIDTRVAMPLAIMVNELSNEQLKEFERIFQHLMIRNLRRGLKLNLASAQDCIATINSTGHYNLPLMTVEQVCSGRTGEAIKNGKMETNTPLWFYVLKEAEVLADGNHLGPLGSVLVAETLAGLAIKDDASFWHQSGSDHGRWHPDDGVKPTGETVDSIEALLRAALVL